MRKRIRKNSNLYNQLNKENNSSNNVKVAIQNKEPQNVQYRINKKGEKRRILFSIPLVILILFIIILYMLSVEIYSNYDPVDMNELIRDFNIQISKSVIEDLDNHVENTIIWDFSSSYAELENGKTKKSEKKATYIDSELTKLRIDDDLFLNSVSDVGVESKAISQNNYVTSSGEKYHIIANLKIDSLGIDYPILSSTSDDLLKISLTKYWGADPNQKGNMVVLGHNYESKQFFSKLSNIEDGAIIEITDLSGRTLQYSVYDTEIIDPYDNSCTSQLTNGNTEITLITCYNRDANRFVVKARANI